MGIDLLKVRCLDDGDELGRSHWGKYLIAVRAHRERIEGLEDDFSFSLNQGCSVASQRLEREFQCL